MLIKNFIKDGLPTISPTDIESVENASLIDVRRPDEFIGELGHIEEARLITLGPDLDNFLLATDKRATIIFICRSGARSGKATSQALALGFQNIYNMDGGMLAWNNLSLPIKN